MIPRTLRTLVASCIASLALLAPAMAEDLVTPATTQTYGYQEAGPMLGGFAARKPASATDFHFTVGIQSNGMSSTGRGITWGLAAEATAAGTSEDWLVGVEALVINANAAPRETWITANNASIGCRTYEMIVAGIPCAGPNNVNSRAYWITAQQGTGFESALKLDGASLYSMPGRPKPAVIDLRDVREEDLKGWCLIATRTRCITVDDIK